jgi:beta-galactosidase
MTILNAGSQCVIGPLPFGTFRPHLLTLIAVCTLAACGGSETTEPRSQAQAAGASEVRAEPITRASLRTSTSMMSGWQFVQDDALTDEEALANDGSAWESVTLPHTWNATDAATTEQSTPSTPDYKRGKGWYRLEFVNTGVGATQRLQFDAASIAAEVWLNGRKLGQHRGAFTAFRFNITDVLKPGKNVLLVKTDNSPGRNDGDPTAIAPLSGDFNMSGGLYRAVSLISTRSAAHIALDDFGSTGVFARTTALSPNHATVNVVAKVKNGLDADGTFTVTASLVEADGRAVKKSASKTIALRANEAVGVSQELAVEAPRLWEGLADPYLYHLVVELKTAQGVAIDRVVQNFGIRQMRFDGDNGFFLNGRSVPLRGVNMHQDLLGKAWAVSNEDIDRSFALIKEVGANTLRLAHYPHSDYTVEQADRLGIVVMAELPLVNATSVRSGVDPETTGFGDNARAQLTELIRQKYNNASVGIWSIANEVQGGTTASNNVLALLRSLHQLAKNEDPDRITSLAHQVTRSGDIVRPDTLKQTGITDSYGINRYFQWYYGTSETQLGENLDALHAENPTQPIGVTEYGAGNAITHHTDNVYGGRVCSRDTSGSRRICYQPEGYANYVHEKAYSQFVTRPYIMGTWIWNMFDFGSGNRHEGDIGQTNTKGIVTFGREVNKDVFYFYKANWTQSPVTYISGRRYTERAYAVADINVYSNGSSVTLRVNGVPVQTKSAADCPLKVCAFKGVALRPGANAIAAHGTHGASIVTDAVEWNLAAERVSNVFIAAGQLATGFVSNDPLLGTHTFGSDNFFVGGQLPAIVGFSTVGLSNYVPVAGIGETAIPETGRVWDMWRLGAAFGYQIPVPNGNYKVTLGFLEPTVTAAGARVFDVSANGVKHIERLDVFQSAGARNTAIVRSFMTDVTDGTLALDFKGVTGDAIVSNISIVRQ